MQVLIVSKDCHPLPQAEMWISDIFSLGISAKAQAVHQISLLVNRIVEDWWKLLVGPGRYTV